MSPYRLLIDVMICIWGAHILGFTPTILQWKDAVLIWAMDNIPSTYIHLFITDYIAQSSTAD